MKRSEIVKTIKDFFYDNDFYNFDDEHADLLLSKLESQGMQPPVYEKRIEIRMMPYNQVWTSSKPVNEWEVEE